MKKMLALILALMLALPFAALAEPSTSYTIALMDPIIGVDGMTLDMTGMDLELSGYVSDIGTFAADVLVNVGENFENNALCAYAQLDSKGISFSAEGLSNVYTVDLGEIVGTNITPYLAILPMFPVNTLLNQPMNFNANIDLSLSTRAALVESLFASYNNGGTIAISSAQGEQLVDKVLDMVERIASSMGEDLSEVREAGLSFDMNACLTSGQDGYVLTGNGNIYAEGNDPLGYDISLNDSESATAFALNLHEPGGTERITLELNSNSTPGADGRSATQGTYGMYLADGAEVMENFMQGSFSATPVADSTQMDYLVDVTIAEDAAISLLYSNGTYAEGLGFNFEIAVSDMKETVMQAYMYYAGEKSADEYGSMLNGYVSMGIGNEDQLYTFDTGLLLMSTAMDTANWVYDASAAIDVMNMDQNESNAAMMGLMGIAGNAYTLINEHVPGLAPMMDSLMGSIM